MKEAGAINSRLRNTSGTELWLRASGSRVVGLGHVMRMIALALAAQEAHIPAHLVTPRTNLAEGVAKRFGIRSVDVEWWSPLTNRDSIVVFDGYEFSIDDHREARRSRAIVAAMHDYGSVEMDVDMVINQNLVEQIDVDVPSNCRVLLGPQFALLKPEFRRHRRQRGQDSACLLVTMGGSDPHNHTETAVEIAIEMGGFDRVIALVGGTWVGALPPQVEIVRDPPSVARVFDTADAAIAAAGSTAWELLCMGIPTALIQTEPNQVHIGEPLGRAGGALFLGSVGDLDTSLAHRLNDVDLRHSLSARGMSIVDGLGANRVLNELLTLVDDRYRSS